jgi:hypothetical protein
VTKKEIVLAPWVAELADGWELPSSGVVEIACNYDGVCLAWWDTDSVPLLVWLAARLAPTISDLQDVVTTAVVLVQERLPSRGRAHLSPANVFGSILGMWPRGSRNTLAEVRDTAAVCLLESKSVAALSDAAFRTTVAAPSGEAPGGPDVRLVPALLALSVGNAAGAYASYHMMRGAPFAAVLGGDDKVRERHSLEKCEGSCPWLVVRKRF